MASAADALEDMRILDLAEFYSERGGGVRSYLDKMLACAGQLGHEVIVVAPGPRDEETRVAESGRIVRYRAPRMPRRSRSGACGRSSSASRRTCFSCRARLFRPGWARRYECRSAFTSTIPILSAVI